MRECGVKWRKLKFMKIDMNSPISAIKWSPEIEKFLKSKKYMNNLGAIYMNNADIVKRGKRYRYASGLLRNLPGFRPAFYLQISKALENAGLPPLRDSIQISRDLYNSMQRSYESFGGEGSSSG